GVAARRPPLEPAASPRALEPPPFVAGGLSCLVAAGALYTALRHRRARRFKTLAWRWEEADEDHSCPAARFLRRGGARDRHRRARAGKIRRAGLRASRDRPQPPRRGVAEGQGSALRRRI